MWNEQGVGQGTIEFFKIGVERNVLEDFADEGLAVGVRAGGTQPNEDIAGLKISRARQEARTLDNADDGASHIEFVGPIDAGHLSRFAA